MVHSLGCHGRSPRRHLPLGLHLQATVSATDMVPPRREPTHPAVLPRRWSTGEGLPDLALMAHAPGPVLALDHTRVDDCVAAELQALLQAGLARPAPPLDALSPAPFSVFFALPLGSTVRPASDGAPEPTCGPVGRGRRATAAGVEAGGRLSVRGIGEAGGQRPRTAPLCGSAAPGGGRLVGPCAHDERPEPLALGRAGGMVPPVPSRSTLRPRAALRLFFTKLHGASNSLARGVRWCPRGSGPRSAWRPALRSRRATGSGERGTRRAGARLPPPAPTGSMTASVFSSGLFVWNNAVPRRAEHSSPQGRHRRRRRRSWPET